MLGLLVLTAACGWSLAANPEPPRGVIGQKKLATAVDCSGPVGFTAVGNLKVHQSGLIAYKNALVDHGVGLSRETGEFTVHCPGIYHIAFTAYGVSENTKVVLRKRTNNQDWADILSAGGPKTGGGSNQVLLELNVGDQTGLWLKEGELAPETSAPSTSFTAFRIAKK
ncbi:C1q-like venom protein [Nesidiocoris tenuis]|uniref:C1q-like venom protein n=1 Tax=Nesidiocoris tenuis TaxID=355587 RepID=A0ABN7B9P9_9HEMI|nr:C1q-like venom protein [Nesidiocoris tenuis]